MALRRRCRAILFDLDDTLIPTSRIDRAAIATAAATSTPGEKAAVAKRFAALLKDIPFPPLGSTHTVAQWRAMLWERASGRTDVITPGDEVEVSAAAQAAHDLWVKERLLNFRFSAEVRSLVVRLQQAGYVTGVLTNGHADVQRAKTQACGAEELFGYSRIIVAGEHPEQKPAPSIFRTACTALGVPAEETVMVGDSYAADMAGGMKAGYLATVWIRPTATANPADESLMFGHLQQVPAGQPEPSFTIESITELEAVLRELNS